MTRLSKSKRERQMPYGITYMQNLKYDTNEHIHETETDSQTQKTDSWLPNRLNKEQTGSLQLADTNYYMQNENNKVLLYSTGTILNIPR